MNPLTPCCRKRARALDRVWARGIDARERDQHVCVRAAASAISSFGIGAIPLRDSQSTVKTTAASRARGSRRRRRRPSGAAVRPKYRRAAARSSAGIGSCPARDSSVWTWTSIAETAARSITARPYRVRPAAPRPTRGDPTPLRAPDQRDAHRQAAPLTRRRTAAQPPGTPSSPSSTSAKGRRDRRTAPRSRGRAGARRSGWSARRRRRSGALRTSRARRRCPRTRRSWLATYSSAVIARWSACSSRARFEKRYSSQRSSKRRW